ncbi:MAG: hypothetical protein H6855_01960 [Rhodospirillales bacterium]|nr:hypothetical protein [Rhodospirillales bacterium]MCB9964830.1 hypothetical protein [Rhodospirillales bacterium]
MKFLSSFLTVILIGLGAMTFTASAALAHDEGNERPVRLDYQYYAEGELYERLVQEFTPEWEATDEMLRTLPIFGVHRVDLNNDGVPELIVRLADQYTTCNDMGCHHAVLAITDEAIRRLGYFEFCEIEVAPTETDGVKDLLVFDSPLNDFSPSLYIWDANEQMYKKSDRGHEDE